MALEPCRECGEQVSTNAPKCPHCGTTTPAPSTMERNRNTTLIGCTAITLIPIAFFFYVCADIKSSSPATDARQTTARECHDGFRTMRPTDYERGTRIHFEEGEHFGTISALSTSHEFGDGTRGMGFQVAFEDGSRQWYKYGTLGDGYVVPCY